MTREQTRRWVCSTLLFLALSSFSLGRHAQAAPSAPPHRIVFKQASPDGAPLWLYRLGGYVLYPATAAPLDLNPARVFIRVCQAPCATSLTPGSYRLGIEATTHACWRSTACGL